MALKVGIIGAMDEEIKSYLKHFKLKKKTKWKIFTFYEGMFNKHKVILVKSGVGKVFAAMVCQHMIDFFKVDRVIFTGVGGSINSKLDIGDVVVSTDSVHHDFNAVPLGFKRGQISYTPYRFFKAEKKMIDLAMKSRLEDNKIIKGRILTGDQFFTQAEKKKHKYLKAELKGDCIEMEGAAVAQVCSINGVPHIIIRTVSDKADGTAVSDYNKFKALVAHNSFIIVKTIIEKLN